MATKGKSVRGNIDSCTCSHCKEMCYVPCIPSPSQYAAYPLEIKRKFHAETRMLYLDANDERCIEDPCEVSIMYPNLTSDGCVFLTKDRLCSLHKSGMKPIEGQLVSCKKEYKEGIHDAHELVLMEWDKLSTAEFTILEEESIQEAEDE